MSKIIIKQQKLEINDETVQIIIYYFIAQNM